MKMIQYNTTFENFEPTGGSEVLYSKVQKVCVKNNESEERVRDLRLSVSVRFSSNSTYRKTLQIQVTDDEDPYVLYSLILTEDDYNNLKTTQGLLVDFDNFPSQVVRLLEKCDSPNVQNPKFLLFLENTCSASVLSMEGCLTYLKIVETNPFKHLCHLSVAVNPGSDNDVMKQMTAKLKALKAQVAKVDQEIVDSKRNFNELRAKFEFKCQELIASEKNWSNEKNSMSTKCNEEICLEKEKFNKAQLEWTKEIERVRCHAEERNMEFLKELESENTKLRSQCEAANAVKFNSEATIREQSHEIERLKKEMQTVLREASSLRQKNERLENNWYEREEAVRTLELKMSDLEQDAKDKCDLMVKQQEVLKIATEQQMRLEESLNKKDHSLQRKQMELQSVSEDLGKAHEIIAKLQGEVAQKQTKLKQRTQIALEQERIVDELRVKTYKMADTIEHNNKQIEEYVLKNKSLEEENERQFNKIEDLDKTIKKNDNVISWLNRCLTDQRGQSGQESAQARWNVPGINTAPSMTTSTPYLPPPTIRPQTQPAFTAAPTPASSEQPRPFAFSSGRENAARPLASLVSTPKPGQDTASAKGQEQLLRDLVPKVGIRRSGGAAEWLARQSAYFPKSH